MYFVGTWMQRPGQSVTSSSRIALLYRFSSKQGVLKTHSNTYDGAFCEYSDRFKAVNYFTGRSLLDVWFGFECW